MRDDPAAWVDAVGVGSVIAVELDTGARIEAEVVDVEEVTPRPIDHAAGRGGEAVEHLVVTETAAGARYLIGTPLEIDGGPRESWCGTVDDPYPLETVLDRDVQVMGAVLAVAVVE